MCLKDSIDLNSNQPFLGDGQGCDPGHPLTFLPAERCVFQPFVLVVNDVVQRKQSADDMVVCFSICDEGSGGLRG